jgi:hypothetical protein
MNKTVNIPNLINGVLDLGAKVNYTFNLTANSGWNNTYTIILPNNILYQRTTGSVNGNKINWDLKNWDGSKPNLLSEISI